MLLFVCLVQMVAFMIVHKKDEFHSGLLEIEVDTAGIVTATDPLTGEITRYTKSISYKKIKTDFEKKLENEARKKRKVNLSPYQKWANINFEPNSLYNNMLCNCELTASDIYVWHVFASQIRIDNWVCIQQSILCRRYGLSKATVSRAVKKLVQHGYLERHLDGQCLHKIPKTMAYCGSWKHFTTPDDDNKLESQKNEQLNAEGGLQ